MLLVSDSYSIIPYLSMQECLTKLTYYTVILIGSVKYISSDGGFSHSALSVIKGPALSELEGEETWAPKVKRMSLFSIYI